MRGLSGDLSCWRRLPFSGSGLRFLGGADEVRDDGTKPASEAEVVSLLNRGVHCESHHHNVSVGEEIRVLKLCVERSTTDRRPGCRGRSFTSGACRFFAGRVFRYRTNLVIDRVSGMEFSLILVV